MRIAMVSYHTCPRASVEGKETGGMNVYVLELSRALARMGHHVDIFTRSHEATDPLILQESENLRIMHIPAGPQEAVAKKKLVLHVHAFREHLETFMKEHQLSYDITHAHYYLSGLAVPKTHPFIMSFHTLALMKNLVARDTLERESMFRIKSERTLMHHASIIVASSESDKEYMQYLYDVPEAKIRIVHPGIDTTLFHPMEKIAARDHIGATREHKIVLFVGRIEPLKGIDTLLYAMKILKKQKPLVKICLWIVGGDTSEIQSRWPKTLKKLATLRATLRIAEDHVHFVGRQPQTELPYYYNSADIVVMPSHYESFGMSALEAMGCGIPVITTNVAGISAHVAHVTSANNPLLLAETIDHVLEHVHPEKPFRLNTWDQTAEKLITVYRLLM